MSNPLKGPLKPARTAQRTCPISSELTVVVPAYNEEQAIGSVLERIGSLRAQSGQKLEVIVIDDGSHDQTAQVAKGYDGVSLLCHGGNRGYGAALKTGIRHAQHQLICIVDSDATYPSERIPDLVDQLLQHKLDMVVGARGGQSGRIPLIRRPAKWVIARLAELVCGRSIPDLNSGLRVFRRDTSLRFFSILPDGFSFTTTLTLAMLTNGYSLDYVPIDYRPRVGRSKIRPLHDTLNFINLVLRIALYFAPLKIFLPLSGLLFLAAIGLGLFSKFVLGQLADVSTLILFVAAAQVAVVGLLAELINRRLPNYYREES